MDPSEHCRVNTFVERWEPACMGTYNSIALRRQHECCYGCPWHDRCVVISPPAAAKGRE